MTITARTVSLSKCEHVYPHPLTLDAILSHALVCDYHERLVCRAYDRAVDDQNVSAARFMTRPSIDYTKF